MIRVKTTVDLTPLDSLAGALDNHKQIVQQVGQRIHNEWAPQLLAELRVVPGSVKYPIEWTSEAQRKAYWATDGFGKGIPFQRDGSVSDAWEVLNISVDGSFAILVRNTNPASRWLYGSLAKNPIVARSYQQQFHRNTGWQEARNTVNLWMDVMTKAFIREFIETMQATIKRRAYTR